MLTSKRKVSRYSLLRALASSNTICDSPSGAWALYMWFHLSILRRRFFSSRWNDQFFFRAVLGLGTFSLDPFVVSFSRRQPSNEDVFTANVLYLCNLCSVYLEFYTYWCVFSSKPWLQISLCVCWCGASIAVVSGIPVHPKKIRKIPKNTQNSSKYTQNYTQVYFIPEIQRKWYTEYPYLSYNIPYSRFKKPLYTVYPKTLADPDLDSQKCWMLYCHVISFGRVVGGRWLHLEIWLNCI